VSKYPDLQEEPKGVVDHGIRHAISLTLGAQLPKGRVYRMSPADLDEIRKKLAELTYQLSGHWYCLCPRKMGTQDVH
jgi:hypothetical protein